MSDKMTFEEAIKKLEVIVKELESGNLELEAMVKKFNEGIELSNLCNELLKDARDLTVKLIDKNKG